MFKINENFPHKFTQDIGEYTAYIEENILLPLTQTRCLVLFSLQ